MLLTKLFKKYKNDEVHNDHEYEEKEDDEEDNDDKDDDYDMYTYLQSPEIRRFDFRTFELMTTLQSSALMHMLNGVS
jgi:hypothetical protein